MITCRPTQTLSLCFSLSPSVSLTHSSLSFSDSLCLLFSDISCLKSNFLISLEITVSFDVEKIIHLFKDTNSHTVSKIFTITQMSHKHLVLEGQMSSKKNAEKLCKHLVRRAMAVSERSKKKSPAAQASGDSAMLLHSSDCSKPVHNHFLKNMF